MEIYSGEKYNRWNEEPDVTNHHVFTITSELSELTSNFEPTYDGITLQNYFLSAPGSSGGVIDFKDPWLIDYPDPDYGNSLRNRGMKQTGPDALIFKERPSPFNPDYTTSFNGDVYQGAFLNQNPDPNDPNVPHYSVRAVEESIGGVEYFLLNWSGSNVAFENSQALETAVVFTGANAVVTANMKGHLVSGTTTATTYNNQRKMVWDDIFQKYHMVYEDGGHIWYSWSADDGATWADEELVSDWDNEALQYPAQYPSIDVINGTVVVVWQKDWGWTGEIFVRCKTAAGWQNAQGVALFIALSGAFYATPVLAVQPTAGGFTAHIVWHDLDGNNLKIRSYNLGNGAFETEETDIPSTNSNSMYPSVAADINNKLHLVWEESGEIYYSKFGYDSFNNEYVFLISKEAVSKGAGYSAHVLPSVTTDYWRRPNVTWQAYSGVALEMQIILHRRRELSGAWNSATSFIGNDDYFKPSIMSFPGVLPPSQELRAVWRRGDNLIWIGKYNGSSWSTIFPWLYGVDPSISSNMSVDKVAKMVFRSSGSSPYTLTTSSANLIDPPSKNSKTTTGQSVHHRRGVLALGKAEIAFELGEFEIDGTPVNLLQYSDTLIVGQHQQWAELFRSEVFRVSNETHLSYFRGFEVLNRDTLKNVLPPGIKIELRLEAVNAQSNQTLAILDRQVITRNIPPDLRQRKSILYRLGSTKDVFLRIGLGLPKGLAIKQSMVEVYYESDGDSLSKGSTEDMASVTLTPERFELKQNYPNPFNPETTISFALPKSSDVKLEIFDISGRRIKTLINGALSSGFYEVEWDGKNQRGIAVTSGVYVYRLKAGDFVKSRKLMLIR